MSEPSPLPVPKPSATAPRSCLIVDDSRMIRGISRRIVERLGYEVIEGENGQEALDRCRHAMPDLILVDWDMPIMTGIEFVTALRGLPGGRAPKVVFCTSKSGAQDVHKGVSAGADEWVAKPFESATLLRKLTAIGAA